jgi:hypothetical protein
MNRLAFALLLVAVAGCATVPPAHGAPHYAVRSVTAYVSVNDDAGATCAVPLLIPAMVSDSVWVRCEFWQSGTLLLADSTRTPRAVWLTFAPPASVPAASKVTATIRVRDAGGTSCPMPFDQTPTVTIVKPAAVSGVAVAP